MKPLRIILVDDHQIMLDGISALLKNDERFSIVGTYTRCAEALAEMQNVDVVITDIQMPEMNGLEFTKVIRSKFSGVFILALSMSGEDAMVSEMLNAGVNGYVLKNTGQEELKNALMTIVRGETYLSPEIAAALTRALVAQRKEAEDPAPKLTQREIEIIKLIAKEYSNEKIANELFISERTVETHRKNIFRKTGTKGVVGLLKYAMDKKII
jgi:two-component system, NarL family, nitrate/nitrite response regulator NarL